jgi:hypothetical protein
MAAASLFICDKSAHVVRLKQVSCKKRHAKVMQGARHHSSLAFSFVVLILEYLAFRGPVVSSFQHETAGCDRRRLVV